MGDITINKAFEDYKTVYMPYRNFAERTRVEYQNDIEDLILFLGHLGIKVVKALELPQLERYLAELENRGFADSTRKRKVIFIRSFLTFLYQDQYINLNLAKRVIPPFVDSQTPRFLTKAEYQRLLELARSNPRDLAIIQLLLQTGIKLSELTRLTINDVELPVVLENESNETGYLRLSGGERQRPRIIPLNYKACITLHAYLKIRSESSSVALFINRFGKHLTARGVEKVIHKYLTKSRIANANVQSLRYTFGVHHIKKGTSTKTIQETLGFKDPRSTARYLSLAQKLISRELQSNTL